MVSLNSVRWTIAYLWLGTFFVCAFLCALKYVGTIPWPSVNRSVFLPAVGAILGFLSPQVTIVLVWIVKGKKDTEKVSRSKSLYLVLSTVIYLISFLLMLVGALFFLFFDPNPSGQGVLNNVGIVISLMGTVSFIGIVPLTYLFK